MRTAIIAAALLAASLGFASQANARNCWWNGYEWQCRPSHYERPRWQAREWERRRDGVHEWNPRHWSNAPYPLHDRR